MFHERADEIPVVFARRGKLVGLDQFILICFFYLSVRQQLLEYGQAHLLLVELAHHLEPATQPELEREQPQYTVEKTIDCA